MKIFLINICTHIRNEVIIEITIQERTRCRVWQFFLFPRFLSIVVRRLVLLMLVVSCLLCRQQEHAGLNPTESMTRALISDDNIARQSALGPVQLGYVPRVWPPSLATPSSPSSPRYNQKRQHLFPSFALSF